MFTTPKFLGAIAATAAIALGAANPASAAPFALDDITVGPDNGYWIWDGATDLSLDGPSNDVWDGNTDHYDTWDDTGVKIYGSAPSYNDTNLECADPADLSDASDGSGDKVLTCDDQVVDNGDGELTVTTEYRFYADGKTLRMRYILTNNGDSEISEQYLEQNFNAYQDSGTNLSYTDTDGVIGDFATDYDTVSGAVTNEDNYIWITDDRTNNDASPVVKYAIGREGSTTPMLVDEANGWISGGQGDGEDMAYLPYQIPALAPGQSVEFLFLVKVFLFDDGMDSDLNLDGWQEGTKWAIDQAVADTAVESDAVVFAGISDTSKVLNWKPQGSGSEGLADTGFNTAPLGVAAIVALAGGVAIAARRRRASK